MVIAELHRSQHNRRDTRSMLYTNFNEKSADLAKSPYRLREQKRRVGRLYWLRCTRLAQLMDPKYKNLLRASVIQWIGGNRHNDSIYELVIVIDGGTIAFRSPHQFRKPVYMHASVRRLST
jgi:hypothetical protein